MRPCVQFSLFGLCHLSDSSYRLVRLNLILFNRRSNWANAPAPLYQLGRLCLNLTTDQLVPFNWGVTIQMASTRRGM